MGQVPEETINRIRRNFMQFADDTIRSVRAMARVTNGVADATVKLSASIKLLDADHKLIEEIPAE